jgi:hypothetical protein
MKLLALLVKLNFILIYALSKITNDDIYCMLLLTWLIREKNIYILWCSKVASMTHNNLKKKQQNNKNSKYNKQNQNNKNKKIIKHPRMLSRTF